MRQRVCPRCGKEFPGEKAQRLCVVCLKEVLQETVVRTRICATCGVPLQGGPRARYCPNCRAERARKNKSEYQRRKAAGKVRTIGSIDICQVCGKEYTVEGGLQKYCPACAPEAVRQKVLPQKRARAAEHIDERNARRRDLLENSAVCAYCGKPYTPASASVTCSEACAREYQRITQGMADYKRGKRKSPPGHERYSSGIPQSELPGVSYHSKRKKWQVSHNGVYIGLFETREEAEAKKRELQGQS